MLRFIGLVVLWGGVAAPACAQLLSAQISYPPEALMAHAEGTVGYEVSLAADGSVKKCRVTQSSGNAVLDQQTCRQLRKAAHFQSGMDVAGRPVASTYAGKLRWSLPSEQAPSPQGASAEH